jgi:hypothetical protein
MPPAHRRLACQRKAVNAAPGKETEMKLKHLTSVAMMGASWLLAGSCAFDERELTLAGIGGSSSGGPAGSALGGPEAAPRLAVGTSAIDLGWVTTGFAARTRIRVDNLGNAPLPAPAVAFAAGSHADFSLIQNGCAQEVPAGESCELRVQLVPSGDGERAATLEVRSDVGGEAQVALNGLGLIAGDLILAPVAGSFEDFGGARLGSTREETFSISNPTDVASGPLRFRVNRPEFVLLAPGPGDCVPDVTSLVGGQSCTLRLAFTPTERGPLEATLTGATDGVGAVSLTLAGRGLARAALSVSAPTVDFAGVVLLSSAQRNVLFENAGDEPLTLAGSRLAPENAEGFSILNSDCGAGAQIAGGASCSVQVEFRPPRVGEELTAELIAEGVEVGQAQSVALRGIGLEPGALTVSAAADGSNDFGEVLLGETSERSFLIQNPSAQASGVLDIVVSEGFALAEPTALAEGTGAAGECIPGSTSLVDGEACTVRVLFVPSRREVLTGSLTISSPLAGATELPLTGRGILPALLAVERELNFGRVLTGSSGVRTLTIANEGDQALPPPSIELTGSAPAQVAAFSLGNLCTAPLALGETCDLNLTFAPTAATAHAVNLNISSLGSTTSVLLLGEAQVPGSLVLSAAAGGGAFGDVPIGTTTSRAVVLANPGQIPSGRVTISSDNNRFEVDAGDCNQGDPAGLVDGASCSFNVRFTPDDNLAQVANLTVQSPGAGRAGMQLSGRGRQPASLSATGNRDLGRLNVGGATLPANEFTWTVNNQGDLPTGTLSVQNDNPTDFIIRNDSCSGSAVPGRASCQMVISFRPSVTGNRSARIVVSDPTGGRSFTLVVTGLGFQLAALGQSCVNAECAAGVCTRGVCCNRACDRTCQVCSAQGQCIDQSNQEACGNGAACFGVDNCKLPAGRACSQNGGDAQCGSGQCERRLGGTGAGDRICCLDDCGTSLQCNAQNRCQAPALGDGEACGAPGQAACAAGLSCKACGGGGNRCTPNNLCCGPCPGNETCINGTCGCTAQQVPCGGGLCIPRVANACCPATPACDPAVPFCDSRDYLCKQCLNDANCGQGRVCNNGQCACGGTTPVACGNRCIRTDQCCDNSRCNSCQQCNTNTNTCGPLGAGQADRCPGAQFCNAQQQCVECNNNDPPRCAQGVRQRCVNGIYQNDACPPGLQCQGQGSCGCNTGTQCNNQCVNTETDAAHCGGCNNSCGSAGCSDGECNCPIGQEFIPNVGCRLSDGQACTPNQGVPCRNGCNRFLVDCDGDTFPRGDAGAVNRCGTTPPGERPASCPNGRFVVPGRPLDCCDVNQPFSADVHPEQTDFFLEERPAVCGGDRHDYNCDGTGDPDFPEGFCGDFIMENCPGSVVPPDSCGDEVILQACSVVNFECQNVFGSPFRVPCQ